MVSLVAKVGLWDRNVEATERAPFRPDETLARCTVVTEEEDVDVDRWSEGGLPSSDAISAEDETLAVRSIIECVGNPCKADVFLLLRMCPNAAQS